MIGACLSRIGDTRSAGAPADLEMDSTTSTLQSEPRSEIVPKKRRKMVGHEGPHAENHQAYGTFVRDIIIGFSDGLTVPFALTAGLSSLGSAKLVIVGGLAELFSGAISMGLGGFLASLTDRDHFISEEKREFIEVRDKPEDEKEEIYEIMEKYGVGRDATRPLVDALASDPVKWVQFMMDFELKLENVEVSKAWKSAACLGLSYFLGGIIPMIPYFIMHNVTHALFVSIGVTIVVLLIFGFVKNYLTVGTKRAGIYGAGQTLIIGVLAAAASYGIVRALDSRSPVDTH